MGVVWAGNQVNPRSGSTTCLLTSAAGLVWKSHSLTQLNPHARTVIMGFISFFGLRGWPCGRMHDNIRSSGQRGTFCALDSGCACHPH